MKLPYLLADRMISNHRLIIVLGLLVTAVCSVGLFSIELATSHDEFVGDTATTETEDYVEQNFRTGPRNATTAQLIIQRTYHVVTVRDIPKQLHYQKRVAQDRRISSTLADRQSIGISNVIAFTAIRTDRSGGSGTARVQAATAGETTTDGQTDPLPTSRPSLEKQYRTANDSTVWADLPTYEKRAIESLNTEVGRPAGGVYAFVPKHYDTQFRPRAHATVIYIYQDEDLSNRELLESQRAMRAIAHDEFRQAETTDEEFKIRVYGRGVVNDELQRSTIDSLQLVGPFGILLVIGILSFAYRDLLDISLALLGVSIVVVWTFGFMGWVGLRFNQLFVSTPLFLIGLSLDFAVHSIMRYREEHTLRDRSNPRVIFLGESRSPSISESMREAIGSVGFAFVLVTLTTGVGFASSIVSPVQSIREFGMIAAFGIIAALMVFGAFIPAMKIEFETWMESRGYDRYKQPFGIHQHKLRRFLRPCVRFAERMPWLVLGITLLTVLASLAIGATVDTEFDKKQLHVEDTPDWLETVPEPLRPGEYHTYDTLQFFRSNGFVNDNNIAHVLVRGDITHDSTLERTAGARQYAEESNATLEFGRHDLRAEESSSSQIRSTVGPLSAMRSVAKSDSDFNDTFHSHDSDGDSIPDRNLSQLYDAFYEADDDAAATVLHREEGEYRSLRLRVYTDRTESTRFIASEMRTTASLAGKDYDGVTASATGQPVVQADVQQQLFTTLLRSFALALSIVLALLIIFYKWTRNSLVLGMITMIPVLCAVVWILGTMALLDLQFNILTILITNVTVGIGVDYSIHVSERYAQEIDRRSSISDAIQTSVYGTGSALVGSALTTTSGFGILLFAILRPLQQFGMVAAITVIYSLIGSVILLPSLLVLWTRHFTSTPSRPR